MAANTALNVEAVGTNADWTRRREAAVPRAVANVFEIYADRAENAEIWDVEGRRYIDFAGGIAVVNTGHGNPFVQDRIRKQAERFVHTCFQVMPYGGYVELAERLNALVPMMGPKKTLLVSTGAEAIENALKIARAATGRSAFVSFAGGFHGRTMMALVLTGKVVPYKSGFGPFPGEVFHAPYPNALHGVGEEDSLAALDRLFRADVDPQRVAGIVIEPVQGEGGFYIAPPPFLRRLREICDQHGILLIVDEIQTGFARTGRMFAIEHAGVAPDLMAMAKSLAGGMPLAAVTGRAALMDSVQPGGLGGTYAGNPMACAAALGVLEAIEHDDLCGRANVLGDVLRSRLLRAQQRHAFVGDVRALGAMVSVELSHEKDPRRPAAELTKAVLQEAVARGLILISCGVYGNVLRFLFPLTISDPLFEEALGILDDALDAAARRAGAGE